MTSHSVPPCWIRGKLEKYPMIKDGSDTAKRASTKVRFTVSNLDRIHNIYLVVIKKDSLRHLIGISDADLK